MAINFPTSLDVFTDPTASDQLNLPSHSGQHTDLNNAVEALEAKVGINSSAVTSSHDYKIAQLEAQGVATAFTPSWNNLTPGNGTEDAFYTQINDLVVVHVRLVFGSTTSITGGISMSHPVGTARIGGTVPAGVANFDDDDGNDTEGNVTLGVINASVRNYSVSGSQIGAAATNATTPHTWAVDDQIRFSYVYQIA